MFVSFVAANGHLEVKNCTKIYFCRAPLWELTALPRLASWWGEASDGRPKGLDSPFALPWKKSRGRP